MELKDKVIIITGAARIGQQVAQTLKNKGATLAITYLKSKEEAGTLGFPIQANLSKKEDVERVIKETLKKFGRIDGLVHMAAIYEKTLFADLSEANWNKNMDIIAKSAFLLGKAAGDAMLKNKETVKGKIVFFSDWSVLNNPYPEYIAYNTAKSAVVGLTKSFAKALAPHILVNAVAPGPIVRPPDLNDQENEEALAGTPLKRWGGADEIAKGVAYLFDADFVTGHVLTIDGGRTIS